MTDHGHQPNWDEMYAGRPEWDIGRPQPAFLALAEAGAIRGRVLDVGCGTGEHVLMCAGLDLDATGIDVSGAALQRAQRNAARRGLTATFLRHDARDLASLAGPYDTVLDSGLLVHLVENDDDRGRYLAGLRSVVPPGGRYFALCFRDEGPHHHRALTPDEIAAIFADGWTVDAIEPADLDAVSGPARLRAWRIALTRAEAAAVAPGDGATEAAVGAAVAGTAGGGHAGG